MKTYDCDDLPTGSTVEIKKWDGEVIITDSWNNPIRFFCNYEEGIGVEMPYTSFVGLDDANNVVDFPSNSIRKVLNEPY